MTPVHSRQGVGEPNQSGDLTDMVSRPSLEMVSIPRGPAITDPEAFDDCLACNSPATTELSRNPGQLKSLEPPASDVAGWRPIESHDGSRTPVLLIGLYRDGKTWSDIYHAWLQPSYVASDDSEQPAAWARWPHPFPPTHFQAATTPAAPPHPASKELT